ncbi:MAG: arsenate reductase/protein-tyrosine-phosphatase family protein [Acidiferrobacterales bacterium]
MRGYTDINWARVERIVFVCVGNICRSPYAEAVAATHGLSVVSAGLAASAGVQANLDAIRNADRRGINLAGHVTSRICDVNICSSDLLVGMEPRQGRKLMLNNKVQTSGAQVTLLGLWGAAPSPTITDPYGCSDGYFQTCYSRIDSGIAGMLKRIAR